jgi:hypothetical protein
VSYYIVSGYGFEVELRSSLGEEAAKRRDVDADLSGPSGAKRDAGNDDGRIHRRGAGGMSGW